MSNQDTLEIRWIFAVIRRWLWLIVLCGVVAAGSAFAFSSRTQAVYSATATLLVDAASTANRSDYNAIRASELMANTYSRMVTGRDILEMAIAQLKLGVRPGQLAGRVRTESVPDSQLIRISVKDADPLQAALIANTIAETFIARAQALEVEQYSDLLTGLQERIDELSALMEDAQLEIDNLRTSTSLNQADLAQKESLVAEVRGDYRALQRDYQDLRLTMSLLTNSVNIVEAGQVPEDSSGSPYTSTVTLLVEQLPLTGQADTATILASERLATTYSYILTRPLVLDAAITQLGLTESLDSLAERVSVESVPGTQLIWLSVEDADPAQAALLANTIAEEFIARAETLRQEPYRGLLTSMQVQMDELSTLMEDTQAEIDTLGARQTLDRAELARKESLLADYRSEYRTAQRDYEQLRLTMVQSSDNLSIIEAAEVPKNPVGPRTLTYTALAALVGVIVGMGVAFSLEYLDTGIRTSKEVGEALGLNTLGSIGRLTKGEEELVVVTQPRSPIAESFRVLATNIRFSSVDRPLRSLLVTSPHPLEGKSTVVANLAATVAQTGLGCVVVDADLRRPRLHRVFGLDGEDGLTGSIMDGNIDGRLQQTRVKGLSALTSGGLPPNPAELLSSARIQELLQQLAQQVDLVLIDSPPILPVADTTALARTVDGVLLVLEAGHSRREAAQQAVERLRQVGANVIGVVLNGLPLHEGGYYEYGNSKPVAHDRGWRYWLEAVSRLVKRNG